MTAQGLSPEAVTELRCTTALALQDTKQKVATIGCAMAATERHLWINLADMEEKEKHNVLPPKLFSTSVGVVVDKFREVRAQSAT